MKLSVKLFLTILALVLVPSGVFAAEGDDTVTDSSVPDEVVPTLDQPVVEETTIQEEELPSLVTETVCTTTYGGGTECREVEVPQERIVHTPVDTGLVENLAIAAFFFGGGFIMLLVARKLQVL